jgi:hypothetical protein
MAPIFVGSTDDDSRIRGNRVGFAISTANPGSASEGDIYFNSTDKQLRGYDGSAWAAIGGGGGGTAEFTVSGSLSDGQTVILKSDGNVAGVTTSQITQTVGSVNAYTPTSTDSVNFNGVYHSGVEKMVIAYKKSSDQKGYAVVSKITDVTIPLTTAATKFYNNTMEYPAIVYDSNSDRIVIGFEDNSGMGRAIVGTVNANNTITFGTSVKFDTGSDVGSHYISAAFDSTNNKVVFAFSQPNDNDRLKAVVGTVNPSDNSISFGSVTQFDSGSSNSINAVFDENNGKVVIVYNDSGDNTKGKAIVGTVSGTDISFGGEQTFETGNTYHIGAGYDSDNGKIIIAYKDSGDSSDGKAVVGTVSGTSITYGSLTTFSDGNANECHVAYDQAAQKVVITFRDNADSDHGKYQLGTVSGTSISFDYASDSAPTFNGYESRGPTVVYDPSSKRNLIIYKDTNNGNYQSTKILRNAYAETNLTSTNFLGFSDAAYTNGQTATIQMVGAVDDAQTGLTTTTRLFVQTDGTLSTTADTPSVLAGTAISGTKIIVRK